MTREQAIELARKHATRTADAPYHDYQPTPEKARDWMPHEWVIDAIMAAGTSPLGFATVWHEGSKSFYHAGLLSKLSEQDVAAENSAAEGEDPGAVEVRVTLPGDGTIAAWVRGRNGKLVR